MTRPMPSERVRTGLWPVLAALQLAVIAALGVWLALRWRPQPHSDWLYYWNAAGDIAVYERGGLSLWLLAVPKLLGLPPEWAALLLNIPSAALLLYLAYRLDSGRWRVFAQATAAYLLLISPFLGIVQLDLLAAMQLAIGFWLALDTGMALSSRTRTAGSIIATAFAVSTKPQYALVLWALCAMALVVWLSMRRQSVAAMPRLIAILLTGSLLGFATDMGMRQVSGNTEQIRTSSAVTLYAGLLVSSDRRNQGCGYWSVEAARAAKRDLGKPLARAVLDRLRAQPMAHWASVVKCKLPEIFRPAPFALYWLIESPNVRATIDASMDRPRADACYRQVFQWERRLYRMTTLLILLMSLWTAAHLWRRVPALSSLALLWFVAFWAVHAVFEVQGRYFLGLFALAPLLCGLLYGCAGLRGNSLHTGPIASCRPG